MRSVSQLRTRRKISLLSGIVLTFLVAACNPSQAVGMRVRIVADGQQRVLSATEPMSVIQFLQAKNVTLGELDHLDPSEYTPIQDNMTITILRVEEKQECSDQIVAYKTSTIQSTDLNPGTTKIMAVGVNGTERVCFSVHYEDGVEKSRSQSSVTPVTLPIDQVVAVGIDSNKIEPVSFPGMILYISNGQARFIDGSSTNFGLLLTGNNLDGKVFAVSPDGRALLFTRRTDNAAATAQASGPAGSQNNAANELWVLFNLRNQTSKPIRLDAIKNVQTAAWQPQQQDTFSYSTFQPLQDGRAQALNDLNVARLEIFTGKLLSVTPVIKVPRPGPYGAYGTDFSWSPDGKNLAWAQPDGVGVVDFKAAAYKKVFDFPIYKTTLSQRWLWKPSLAWSEDGSLLSATIHGKPLSDEPPENSPVFDIVLTQMAGIFSINPMFGKAGMWAAPQFSPLIGSGIQTHGYIAYLQARNALDSVSSDYDLVVTDRDGSNPRIVFPGTDKQGLNPFNDGKELYTWGPNAKQLAVIYQGDVYIVDIDSGRATKITLVGNAQYPRWVGN